MKRTHGANRVQAPFQGAYWRANRGQQPLSTRRKGSALGQWLQSPVCGVVLLMICWTAGAAEMPDGVAGCVARAGAEYAISGKVDPVYLRGDFDGDGKADYAVVVTRGGKQGVVVCRGSGAGPVVLGAGTAFNEMKNLDFTGWHVHSKGRRVARGFGAGRAPVLLGDALALDWESASAIVYWNGHQFRWYQQGD